MGKRKSLMKSIELREKRKRRREELEVVLFYVYVCIFHLWFLFNVYWFWRLLLSTG